MKTNAKTSRLALTSLVLALLSLWTFLLTAIPAIILAIVSLIRIRKDPARLNDKRIAVMATVISVVSIIIFHIVSILWLLDAPPIPNDYKTTDLHSTPPEYAESDKILATLLKDEDNASDTPRIYRSRDRFPVTEHAAKAVLEGNLIQAIELIEERANSIEKAWNSIQKSREVICRLNTFPQIADLTEPNIEAAWGSLDNLRCLLHIYTAYIHLLSERGNCKTAVMQLIELDSVIRKMSVTARPILKKTACLEGLSLNMRTANSIINNPEASMVSVQLLAEHFTPITDEQTSFRTPFIYDYLVCKNTLDTHITQATKRSRILVRRNSTLRVCRNWYDTAMYYVEGVGKYGKNTLLLWPKCYPDSMPQWDGGSDIPWQYKCYNPVGCLLVSITTTPLSKIPILKTKLKIEQDLFQIVLKKRLGKRPSLKACAYSDEYFLDIHNRTILSVGPDRKAHTPDDIKFPINPELLDFKVCTETGILSDRDSGNLLLR